MMLPWMKFSLLVVAMADNTCSNDGTDQNCTDALSAMQVIPAKRHEQSLYASEDEEGYVFADCTKLNAAGSSGYVSSSTWSAALNAAFQKSKTPKLCPALPGYCAAPEPVFGSTSGSYLRPGAGQAVYQGKKYCQGWWAGANGKRQSCPDGRKNFVKEFFNMATGSNSDVAPFCAIITAVIDHESGFAATALSWDSCFTNAGAAGMFQYDLRSGLQNIPITPAAQFHEFFHRHASTPNVDSMARSWQSCAVNIPGATPVSQEAFNLAFKECSKQKPDDVVLSKLPWALPSKGVCHAACEFTCPEQGYCKKEACPKPVNNQRCGTSWGEANKCSAKQCPGGTKAECGGHMCYAQLDKCP